MNNPAGRLVGVLGGMGPMATVDFLAKVVASTPAACDQEHVPLLAYQFPQIPDRSSAILRGSDEPFAPMLFGLQSLARAGAQLAVIPCNSAHHWHERLSKAQPLRILHIADAVKRELQQRATRPLRPAILATRGTLRSGVYEGRLGAAVAPPVALDEATQTLVDQAIRAVKGGERQVAALAAREAADRALELGAEVLILACTELPVALDNDPISESCIDSTLALARLCVAESTLPP
jgi:aspartate racemase